MCMNLYSHPELYNREKDDQARRENRIYIEDLNAGAVLVSLQRAATAPNYGMQQPKKGLKPENMGLLRHELTKSLQTIHKDVGWLSLNSFPDIQVSTDYFLHRTTDSKKYPAILVNCWNGRPVNTVLRSGDATGINPLLGFESFSPDGFDFDQGYGSAQQIIDALRQSGDPFSRTIPENSTKGDAKSHAG